MFALGKQIAWITLQMIEYIVKFCEMNIWALCTHAICRVTIKSIDDITDNEIS